MTSLPNFSYGVFFHIHGSVPLTSPSMLSLSIQPPELRSRVEICPDSKTCILNALEDGGYSLESIFFPHLQSADICVAAGTVPVALHWFGVQWCNNSKIFTHPVQQVTGNPEVVGHVDALTGAHLELPLQTKTESGHATWGWCVVSRSDSHWSLLRWWYLPEMASLQRWCHRFWPPRRDRPCSGTPRCHVRRHYLLPPHSSKVLDGDDNVASVLTQNKYEQKHIISNQ